jgi:alkylhydroperoxidase/carboxymuconolactone decarboxylase family protein YurZ
MSAQAGAAEERLRGVARGDLAGFGVLEDIHSGVREVSGLDTETYQLVQIAALAAIDGSPVSWLLHLGAAEEAHLDLDKVLGTLIAVAPIVGTPRVVSAGAKIMRAVGLAEAVAEAEER